MKKIIALLLSTTLALGSLTACSGSGSNASNGGSTSSEKVKQVVVALGNAWKPFCYTNENGQEDGYEYKVLQAIDKKLPQYEFTFKPMDFTNVLVSLDSGKADLAAHTFTLNSARAAKYGYTTEVYYQNVVRLLIDKSNNQVHSLADLAGKPVLGVTGDASTEAIEAWNTKNPDKAVKLQYANYTMEQTVAAIHNGTLAAWFCNESVLKELNDSYGNKLKFADGDPVLSTSSVFYLNKKDTALKSAVDSAIKELREDGTLTKLSIQYTGVDVSGAKKKS